MTAITEESLKMALSDLVQVVAGYKQYIDALPDDVVATLPAMPGIDGDWADETIDSATRLLKAHREAAL